MRIIPAIDIIDGQCVRLSKGDYATKKVYNQDPVEVAKEFEAAGIRYLHLVDLDGAKSRHIVNHKVLHRIATQTGLHIDFGGGIKSIKDLDIAFSNGARQVTAGSIAVTEPDTFMSWLETYGAEKLILGADCKNRKIAINGWETSSEKEILSYIQYYESKGITEVICTDVEKDGMLTGPPVELYREIIANTNINLVASGGVAGIDDVLLLKNLGCKGVIIGKALYEGKILLNELVKLC